METKFNFKSQICTTRNQLERLLALGIKKETADMCSRLAVESNGITRTEVEDIFSFTPDDWDNAREVTPRWSMHRMIEMMPYCVEMYNKDWCLQVSKGYVRYASIGKEKSYIGFFQKPNTFDAIIDCIEWLIKEGYFNKEYLV